MSEFDQPEWGLLDYIPAKRMTMEELVKAWVNPAWNVTGLMGHIKDVTNELTQARNELAKLQLTAQQPAPAPKKTGLQRSLDGACAIIVKQEAELKELRAKVADDAAFITGLESEIVNLETKLGNMPEAGQAEYALCCCGHLNSVHLNWLACSVPGCGCSDAVEKED